MVSGVVLVFATVLSLWTSDAGMQATIVQQAGDLEGWNVIRVENALSRTRRAVVIRHEDLGLLSSGYYIQISQDGERWSGEFMKQYEEETPFIADPDIRLFVGHTFLYPDRIELAFRLDSSARNPDLWIRFKRHGLIKTGDDH